MSTPTDGGPETVICRYQVKPGCEGEMESLLAKHWPVLHGAGLVTDKPPMLFRGKPSEKPEARHDAARVYVEIFEWKFAGASGVAHEKPEVGALWGPMAECCESMDFPHFEPLDLGAGGAGS